MDLTSRFPIRQLTVLAQDPSVLKDGNALTISVPVADERLTPGPKGSRIHVVDFDATENRYFPPRAGDAGRDPYADVKDIEALVASRDFHAQNTYGHVATTLAQFEAALGRHISWSFESNAHHIKVAPHAFIDANAFYSRRDEALCFGYFPKGTKTGKPEDYVFTCLSADIVTHETAHGILDGLHRELMRPCTLDQPAFHEGFADIVALLSALARSDLLKLVLPVKHAKGRELIPTSALTPKALKKSVLQGLAEEFGKTLAAQHLMNRSATSLRRSATLNPADLDYNALLARGAEAHELGETIVAATMNAFLEIWHARVKGLDPLKTGFADRDRAIEDGTKAAQQLLHMMIRALDYLPPVNMTYRDFLSALLTSDREIAPGPGKYNYRDHIRDVFGRYGIVPATQSGFWEPLQGGASKLSYRGTGYAELMWDREAVMRFLWENRSPLELSEDALTKVNFVKPSVRTGPDGFLVRETIVEYFQLFDVQGRDLRKLRLRKPDGMPDDETVRLLGGGTLVFNDYGSLKFHIGTGVLSKKQSDRVQAVWNAGPEAEAGGLRRFEALHRRRMLGRNLRVREGW